MISIFCSVWLWWLYGDNVMFYYLLIIIIIIIIDKNLYAFLIGRNRKRYMQKEIIQTLGTINNNNVFVMNENWFSKKTKIVNDNDNELWMNEWKVWRSIKCFKSISFFFHWWSPPPSFFFDRLQMIITINGIRKTIMIMWPSFVIRT